MRPEREHFLARERCAGEQAAHAEQGEHTHHRQTDIRNEIGGKARQPLAAGLHAQKGREDHVARAEKHGKQRKAHDNDICRGVFPLSDHSDFSISLLLFPRRRLRRAGAGSRFKARCILCI